MTVPSGALQDHLAQDVTTICYCWRVDRRDGMALGFTDHDSNLEFDGLSFEPDTGFSASRHQESVGFSVDGLEIEGALKSGRLEEEEILAGAFDGAKVSTFLVNWQDVAERRLLRVATIGNVTLADGAFVAELQGLSARLDRVMTRVYRRACDAEVGDARCGMDLSVAPWRGEASVTALEDPRWLVAEGLAGFPDGWFAGGMLTWTGGPRSGRRERIEAHRRENGATRLQLESGDLSGLEAGTAFAVTAGCDKGFAMCRDRFSNALNFRGFPHLPGNDTAYGYVTPDLPLDGKPVVP